MKGLIMYGRSQRCYNIKVFTFGRHAVRVFISALQGQHGAERSE